MPITCPGPAQGTRVCSYLNSCYHQFVAYTLLTVETMVFHRSGRFNSQLLFWRKWRGWSQWRLIHAFRLQLTGRRFSVFPKKRRSVKLGPTTGLSLNIWGDESWLSTRINLLQISDMDLLVDHMNLVRFRLHRSPSSHFLFDQINIWIVIIHITLRSEKGGIHCDGVVMMRKKMKVFSVQESMGLFSFKWDSSPDILRSVLSRNNMLLLVKKNLSNYNTL